MVGFLAAQLADRMSASWPWAQVQMPIVVSRAADVMPGIRDAAARVRSLIFPVLQAGDEQQFLISTPGGGMQCISAATSS
jgi:hypothetical protein